MLGDSRYQGFNQQDPLLLSLRVSSLVIPIRVAHLFLLWVAHFKPLQVAHLIRCHQSIASVQSVFSIDRGSLPVTMSTNTFTRAKYSRMYVIIAILDVASAALKPDRF